MQFQTPVLPAYSNRMADDSYRYIAGFYDRIFEPVNSGLYSLGARMLQPQPGMKVLDVGCGTGAHLAVYANAGCDVYGIDSSASMLGVARKRLGDRADLSLENATLMPYEDNSFDLLLCMLVLHEMDQPTRISALAEMKRVIRPDGCMLLIDFHAGPVRPLKGWFMKPFIYMSELAAGRRHFRNYRHFISIDGLPAIIEAAHLGEAQRRIVAGGAMELCVVQTV